MNNKLRALLYPDRFIAPVPRQGNEMMGEPSKECTYESIPTLGNDGRQSLYLRLLPCGEV